MSIIGAPFYINSYKSISLFFSAGLVSSGVGSSPATNNIIKNGLITNDGEQYLEIDNSNLNILKSCQLFITIVKNNYSSIDKIIYFINGVSTTLFFDDFNYFGFKQFNFKVQEGDRINIIVANGVEEISCTYLNIYTYK